MNPTDSSLRPRRGLPDRPYTRPSDDLGIDLRLDSNEGPAANSRRLVAGSGDAEAVRCYPDDRALTAAIAARFGLPTNGVVLGAGLDELLDRICRAYLDAERRLVTAVPCFPMLPRYTQLAGATLVGVPWSSGAFPQADLLAAAQAAGPSSFVVLTTPNNPTGLTIAAETLLGTVDALSDRLVVVDLAYVEFQSFDPTLELLQRQHVLVLRTFSKGYGLAGLRVGYTLGAAELVAPLRTVGSPFPIAGPSLAAARAALELGPDAAAIARIADERAKLADCLQGLAMQVLPSEANFVFARTSSLAATRALDAALRAAGIQVRVFPNAPPPLDDAVRITCPGDAAAFDRLLAALTAFGGAR
ncbi:MAG: hypothetical protein RL398_414 [Planctomycetota bacterium]